MVSPPIQSEAQLNDGREKSEAFFRTQRLEEDPASYHQYFDEFQGDVADLLELTVDLTQLKENATEIIKTPKLFAVARYFCGPPISYDDLKVIAQIEGMTKAKLIGNSAAVGRIVDVIVTTLDKRRFAWIAESRDADEAEKANAIAATAALMSSQKIQTLRRSQAKKDQEEKVETALIAAGLQKVPTRKVQTFADAPAIGCFCREASLGKRKADFILRLWDNRVMAIECKVSNSSTNSVKRLNNDAAAKAVRWIDGFGSEQVVPAAVLSGVYKLHNLTDAQDKRLCIFWEHDLLALTNWIENTRPPARTRRR